MDYDDYGNLLYPGDDPFSEAVRERDENFDYELEEADRER